MINGDRHSDEKKFIRGMSLFAEDALELRREQSAERNTLSVNFGGCVCVIQPFLPQVFWASQWICLGGCIN